MESSKADFKQKLVQVIMNDAQIKELILLNIVKMLNARKIIADNHITLYSSSAFASIDQNDETFFDVDADEESKLGLKKVRIKFISRKITTIRKVIDIEDFMDKPDYKIVVVNNFAPKAISQINGYKNTELFYDRELQINLIDHILVPKHYKLNEVEIDQLKESYNFDVKTAKRMCYDDAVSKYYNLKIGDIVRIERPSINSGWSIDYRVVVNASIITK